MPMKVLTTWTHQIGASHENPSIDYEFSEYLSHELFMNARQIAVDELRRASNFVIAAANCFFDRSNFMIRRFSFWLILTCFASATTTTTISDDDGPADTVPELKALGSYAGSWDVEITSKGQPFTKGKVIATWILDGRFLQQTGDLQAKDGSTVVKYSSLMTYDPAKKVYRTWIFLSDGQTGDSEGTWSAKDRVMTSIGRKDETGGFSTTTADFSETGVEKWRIVFKDGRGQVVSEMSGRNTRQQK